jgi:short-subunit dehydrogenase
MKESAAIVTGASQGIGRVAAVRLAKDFSGLALAARNAKALEEVANCPQPSPDFPITNG